MTEGARRPASGGALDRRIERRLGRRVPDAPWTPALVALAGAVAFVVVRLTVAASGDAGAFVLAGDRFTDATRSGLPVIPGPGYDGQFFFRLAHGVLDVAPHAHGVTLDTALRFQRVTYPFLAWLASGAGRLSVAWALVAVNVAAIGALGWLGGYAAKAAGRHAVWGLLLPAYFGFVATLARDLSEAVEVAFLVGGLLALRSRRPWAASLLLSAAVLGRETALFAIAGVAVTRLVPLVRRRARLGAEDVAWIVPPLAFAAWQAIVYVRIDTLPATAARANELVLPGSRLVTSLDDLVPDLSRAQVVHVAELVVLIIVLALACASLTSTTTPLAERAAFVGLVVGALSVDIAEGL